MDLKKKVDAKELVSAGWILLVTFLIGLPIVFVDYGEYGEAKEILLLLYLFLEFLPMVVYILAILLPTLSPHLILPWVVVNVILLLVASILALSLSIPNPTLPIVLLALAISLLLIFPVLFAIIMYLPLIVYTKKLCPKYMMHVRKNSLYRRITKTKTAEELEKEIIWRRKEQVKNVVITDRDFEQFIFVNRAAQKWKTKLKKNKVSTEAVEGENDILEAAKSVETKEPEENSDKMSIKLSESRDNLIENEKNNYNDNEHDIDNDIPLVIPDDVPLLSDRDLKVPPTTVYDDGKFVTDV